MLKLKIMVAKSGDLEMELAAVPVDSSGDGGDSSTPEVRQKVCPHGRPIVKRIELADLLREFGRT